jgi:exoribonuclease R
MLPARLSEDVCSLRPGEEKATVTVEMEVAPSGEVKKSRAYRSLTVSDARLTYDGVDAFLRDEGEVQQPELVRAAYELSRKLRTRAAVRGKLELGGREPEYEVDERGGTRVVQGAPFDTGARVDRGADGPRKRGSGEDGAREARCGLPGTREA